MKASRLLTLLLLLQTRQRLSTAELAERLEVSRRTVLRDVDALSAAGVPVYAERGRYGGIAVLPGARLNVSHLEPAELEALSMTGLDRDQQDRLGLAAAAQRAADKVHARHTPHAVADSPAVPLRDVVVAESSAWMSRSELMVDLSELALELRNRRRMRIRYRHSSHDQPQDELVDPYGLATKSTRWYLVADRQDKPRLYSLERLEWYESLDEPSMTRPGETLSSVWAELKKRIEAPGDVTVEARLRRRRVDLAQRILGTRLHSVRPIDDEWCEVTIQYSDVESVRQLLQFGDHLEVIAPASARQRMHDLAADVARRHAPWGKVSDQ
ncbi:helix-turn-helix transcriptional regulator [Citricoccus sp. GCM10030269]|uniref:helix-turn-helix transcriptional regulator n=1 Tax=Citricoccus sp. GCM10030269 TaxID=3273388 RepID=UPI003606B1AC